MKFLLLLALLQTFDPPLEQTYYGPAQPCCQYQSWPRVPSGCTVNRETGLITCGTAPIPASVTTLQAVFQ